ncbi:MAG TPA: hypothetical protein VK914_08580 [bacterium]|jgi:hypothetical protein|nr:hypothetical protein [bacterium]
MARKKPAPAPQKPRRSLGQVYLDMDWLVVVVASWLLPLLGFNRWPETYLFSELFWVLPIVALLPRFFHETRADGRRRRAFFWTCGIILSAGSLLDLAFGRWILLFGPGPYLASLAGIPVEEFIFYLLGPIAMLLVYFWADEYFLRALSPRQRRRGLDASALLRFSPGLLVQALGLLVAGLAAKALLGGVGPAVPLYFSFLVLTAYLPLLLFWKAVRGLVNWQALSLAVLYTLVTSIIWELSLGVPLRWWAYQKTAMLGLWVGAWQRSVNVDLPIEAVSVWMVAPFASIFFFEVITALHHHPAPTLAGKLWGPGASGAAKKRRPKAL